MNTKTAKPITRVPAAMVKPFAAVIKEKLTPYCTKIDIAGNIRRKRDLVSAIRIVCIPREVKSRLNLFDDTLRRDPRFVDYLATFIHVEGNIDTDTRLRFFIQHESLPTPDNLFPLVVDVASPSTWGWKLSEATGPKDFNAKLRRGLTRRSMVFKDERIIHLQTGMMVPAPTEHDFFKMAGFPVYRHPQDRY